MPFYDLNNTDPDDLPEHLQPDPVVIWCYVVRGETVIYGVHYDREDAEEHAEVCKGEVRTQRQRLHGAPGEVTKQDRERQ